MNVGGEEMASHKIFNSLAHTNTFKIPVQIREETCDFPVNQFTTLQA